MATIRRTLATRGSIGMPPGRNAHAIRRNAAAASLAALALLVVHGHVDAPQLSAGIAAVPVVVAAKDIPEGVMIDRLVLGVARWPVAMRPPGAFGSADAVVGRVTRVQFYKGEAIIPGRLAPSGVQPTYEAAVTPGKRPYGIRIADVASLGGTIQPNSRVDVMVVIGARDYRGPVAKLFMSNMRVLATRAAPELTQDRPRVSAAVASIEVTPVQARALSVAAKRGSLQLVLRADGDDDSTSVVESNGLADIKRLKSAASLGVHSGTGPQPPVVDTLARPQLPRW